MSVLTATVVRMIRSQTPPPPGDAASDPDLTEALMRVRPDSLALMLYGSRARGTAGTDSDVDILAIVERSPGSFTHGSTSINYYTHDDLKLLAKSGSLFILHLASEGIILADEYGYLQSALAAYCERSDYQDLKGDLSVILNALFVRDADCYYAGLRRAGVWAARSAVYLASALSGRPCFDMAVACLATGVPDLAYLVKTKTSSLVDLRRIAELGLQALGMPRIGSEVDLATFAIRSWSSQPQATRLIESIISGESELEYTQLTLPIV